MIDLAGSERAAQTQNTGRRMMEGKKLLRSHTGGLLKTFNFVFCL